MPFDPAALPGYHERVERQETEFILAAGLGASLGLSMRAWSGGLHSTRCAAVPQEEPRNQITGVGVETLGRLPEVLGWFDEVGADVYLRWPGPALDGDKGEALAKLGFIAQELEAWMSAPLDRVDLQVAPHDIREVQDEAGAQAFGEAFLRGWAIVEPARRALACAAVAAWPAPASWRRYTAWVDGELAGEAVLVCFGELAYLAEASTLPAFRRRGVQRALIARRVEDARRAGATRIFGAVQYGDQSWANMRAMGLREAYLSLLMRRPGRRGRR